MFGQNEIVGRKFFANAANERLLVTSVFYTLQGEGPFSGLPAVFVRLAKCNLACSFCDTYFDQGHEMSMQELEGHITARIWHLFTGVEEKPPGWAADPADPSRHPGVGLVISGGEPLLQTNLSAFIDHQYRKWEWIQIETNGTQPASSTILNLATIVCSPKCAEKDGIPTHYLKPLPNILEHATALKFVVSADPTSPYHRVPDWAIQWQKAHNRRVYVSPMNVYKDTPREAKITLLRGKPTLEEVSESVERVSFWEQGLLDLQANQANHEHAAALCMYHGFRLNLQSHLYASIP